MRNRIVTKCSLACLLLGSAMTAQAQAQVWRDAATGEKVASGPVLANRPGFAAGHFEGLLPNIGDPDRAYDPVTGRNFVFDLRTCRWIDARTGQAVASGPVLANRPGIAAGHFEGLLPSVGDRDRVFDPVTGRNFVRTPCKQRSKPETSPPPTETVPPPEPAPPPADHGGVPEGAGLRASSEGYSFSFLSLGGSWFKESGVNLSLVNGLVGYRFGPHFGLEGELGVGVKDQTTHGDDYDTRVGIRWSAVPYLVAYLPVSPQLELFGRLGYGTTHFKSDWSAGTLHVSTTSSEGTAALGVGGNFSIDGNDSLRFDYTRLHFDNGSNANLFGLRYVHNFGSH